MYQLNQEMQNESLSSSILRGNVERTCTLLFAQRVWHYQCKSAEVQGDMGKAKIKDWVSVGAKPLATSILVHG